MRRFLVMTIVTAAAVSAAAGPKELAAPAGWPVASPESQGMDSGVLAEMLRYVHDRGLPLHSALIVRNGRVVMDATVYPYEPIRPHDIASATKTVVSALIGIAIDKGYIDSVEQTVLELLPAPAGLSVDARTKRITVEHLLTMTSGFDCGVHKSPPARPRPLTCSHPRP